MSEISRLRKAHLNSVSATLLKFGIAFGTLNFIAFLMGTMLLGGDALNGKIVDGHYFLSSHGRLTEVNADVFRYSAWHARSLLITHPFGMLCAFLYAGKRAAF